MTHIGIVGSGPAGCYLADQLARLVPDARIDLIERLPVPFGLVRYGVAPDHQGTKAISRLLDRVLTRETVRFFGNVEVGRNVQLGELRELYDAIVLATGAPLDRELGIPGEALPGVIGSAHFVGWYNSHPDHAAAPPLGSVHAAVVVGNGNVALDVARVLAKSPAEMVGSDLSPSVYEWLRAQPLETIHIVGRHGPASAKFAAAELAEFGRLGNAHLRIAEPHLLDGAQAEGETAQVIELLRGFAGHAHPDTRNPDVVDIVFHFGATPASFEGNGRLEAVHFSRAGCEPLVLRTQLAITCIGYQSVACCAVSPIGGVFANQDARIAEGLYVTGWAARGPSGTIATNRSEAQRVARRVVADLTDHRRGGGDALAALLKQRGEHVIDYAAWRRIDAAERTCADTGRCRLKFESVDEMLKAASA